MNEDINKEKIEAYLLGFLSGDEAERFDELSFTDDDFSDALKASEADLIDRYVQNDLHGATLAHFESFYRASPKRREKIEFARTLQTFAEREIRATQKNFAAENVESKSSLSKFLASLNIFKNQNSFLQFGFAAAMFFILILSGFLIFKNIFNPKDSQIARVDSPANVEKQTPPRVEEKSAANPSNQTENDNIEKQNPSNGNAAKQTEKTNKKTITEPTPTPKPKETTLPSKPVIASFLLLPSLRGGNRIESHSISGKVTDAAIQLQLEADDYPSYRADLIDQSSGKTVWRSETLKAKSKGANKQLNVSFPAKLLKSQIYALQVSGISADGKSEIISDYPFRIMR